MPNENAASDQDDPWFVVGGDTYRALEAVARVLGVLSPEEALEVLVKDYLDVPEPQNAAEDRHDA